MIAGLAFAIPTFGSVTSDSGFEAADGNLAAGSLIDWNSFSPVTWTGTAPYRSSAKVSNGWSFKGFEDAHVSATDTGYAGGVKQDDDCGTTKDGKAPNKDDLKRIYLATKSVNGEVFLVLSWVRIPQNSISASAHVGYEFNQGNPSIAAQACSGSPVLPKRIGGDMLIVYDFGGSGSTVKIKLSRWLTSTYNPTNASCEVNSSSVATGCWGATTELTAGGFAEGRVFETVGATAQDDLKPPNGASNPNPGTVEFGEAGINLSDAGVFSSTTCNAFGNVHAVSRSSGQSSQAAMMDIVGPGAFTVSNCGTVNVTKSGSDGGSQTGAVFTLYSGATTSGTVVGTCTVVANGDCNPSFANLVPGTYTIDETTVPTGYTKPGTLPHTFTLASGETKNLSFVDQPAPGTVSIAKVDDGGNPVGGAVFKLYSPQGIAAGVPTGSEVAGKSCTTDLITGTCSITGVTPGNYTIDETFVPIGYVKDSAFPKNITVGNGATVNVTATNPRQFKMIVIVCQQSNNTLYSSTVSINGDSRPNSLGAGSASISESALCGLTAGAKGGLVRSANPQSASVTIPASEHP